MKNALILHGTNADHTSNWFTWLGGELEKHGYKVWVPDLPHAEKPNIQRYNKYIFGNQNWLFDKESIIIGHSSGAVATLGLLQNLPDEVVINHAYLVSVFINDLNWEALTELFENSFDYSAIKQHAEKFTLLHAKDDPYCPLWHGETVADELDAQLIVMENQGHFNTEKDPTYTSFPYLLNVILQDTNKAL